MGHVLSGKGMAHFFGYEMVPHTRKEHIGTYKNEKTVYVIFSIVHKEKYVNVTAYRTQATVYKGQLTI